MTPRKGLPEVWPSSITRLMAGSSSCGYEPWVKAHHAKYEKTPSDFDFAKWRIQHTELIEKVVADLTSKGFTVTLENANRFRLEGKTAILVGKPDIVARKGKLVRVVDAKSGAEKDEHLVQVGIYLIALPLAWERPGMHIEGAVTYQTRTVGVTLADAERIKGRFFDVMQRMAGAAPEPTPSERDCKYCDVAACQVRFTGKSDEAVASTEMF